MVYAIIDAVNSIEELITVAYADKPCGLTRWYMDEVRDTADMYLSDEHDFEQLEQSLAALDILAHEDAAELDDIDGITLEAADISVSVVGTFFTYEDMKKGLEAFLSEKPKFKKITVPDNPFESQKLLDELNAALIKSSI